MTIDGPRPAPRLPGVAGWARSLLASLLLLAGCGTPPELVEAERLLAAGEGWQAAAALAPLLDRRPRDPDIRAFQVEALLAAHQTLAAGAAYSRLAEMHGEDPGLARRLAAGVLQEAAAAGEVARRLAVARLASAGGDAGLRLVRGLLDDPEPVVGWAAARSLARRGDRQGVAWLAERAQAGPWPVRAEALAALVRGGPAQVDRAAAVFRSALVEGPPELARLVAWLLLDSGVRSAGRLIAAAPARSGLPADAVLAAQAMTEPPAAEALHARLLAGLGPRGQLPARAHVLLTVLARAGRAEPPLLGRAVRAADHRLRRAAVLGALRLPAGQPGREAVLRRAVADPVTEIAALAAGALSRRVTDASRSRLLSIVRRGDLAGRRAALAALARLGDPRAAALRRRWLDSDEVGLRLVATRQLAGSGDRALLPRLRLLLVAREPEERVAGAAAVLRLIPGG